MNPCSSAVTSAAACAALFGDFSATTGLSDFLVSSIIVVCPGHGVCESQSALLQSLTATYTLSELRYKEGLEGHLNVLVAQRTLYSAQQGITATRLFKALGGQL